jgi:tetratricopeptide (TPR) repeat protein
MPMLFPASDNTEPVRIPEQASDSDSMHTPPEEIGKTLPLNLKNEDPHGETEPVRTHTPQMEAKSEGTQPVIPSTKPSGDGNGDGTSKDQRKQRVKEKRKRWPWILAGIILMVVLGGVGSWIGYQAGIQLRLQKATEDITMTAVTQFEMGMADQEAGRLSMARQRYEYVIRIDPEFPGVQDKLTEVMLAMAETAAPTEVPTPTPIPVTPTPDLRGIEEKFSNAVDLLRAKDWDGAINALDLVRQEDLNYRPVDVDGMYYIALRFRGMQKISNGSLEPGIYDLTLAERFAPLDNQADGFRNWARYYLDGASFWDIDWPTVIKIFGEIYPYMPNLRDGSGWTAQERYRLALINYADQLVKEGKYCDARSYYDQALQMAPDEKIIPTATEVQKLCEPPKPTKTPTPEITATPTLEGTQATTEPPAATTEAPTPTETKESPANKPTEGASSQSHLIFEVYSIL